MADEPSLVISHPSIAGTTFLLHVLNMHPEGESPRSCVGASSSALTCMVEVEIHPGEFCNIAGPDGAERLTSWLNSTTSSISVSSSRNPKYGLKCPTIVRDTLPLLNLQKLSNETKLVIGVRHPARWFEVRRKTGCIVFYSNLYINPVRTVILQLPSTRTPQSKAKWDDSCSNRVDGRNKGLA